VKTALLDVKDRAALVNRMGRDDFLVEMRPSIINACRTQALNAGRPWKDAELLHAACFVEFEKAWQKYHAPDADRTVDLLARVRRLAHDAAYKERLRIWPGYTTDDGVWRGKVREHSVDQETLDALTAAWKNGDHANEVTGDLDFERAKAAISPPLTRRVWCEWTHQLITHTFA
jgi:hypothetical protein